MKNQKTIILIGFALLLSFLVHGQPCNEVISTNPDDPINVPLATTYPGLINPWLNTFDISATQIGNPLIAKDIQLNVNAGWQIPNWDPSIALDMKNPFTTSGTAHERYRYLRRSNIPFSDHDFHWEDGWELLYLGTGNYPNGEGIETTNPNRILSSGTNTPDNPQVPYVILYNRYRGTMRVFMNLFAPFGSYDNVRIILKFPDNNEISGLFRHLEVMDRPLDQTTNIKSIESFNPNSGGTNRWFSADFQMGYDPCNCGSLKELRFDLIGIDTLNINLYGRALSTEIPLMDDEEQPDYDNEWLSVHDVNGGISGGNRIYAKMDGLIDDYKADLTKYEQLSAEYSNYQNRKAALDGFKDLIVDGVAGLVPGGEIITSWFLKPSVTDTSSTSDEGSYPKGSAKGLLGWGYDLLSSEIATGVPQPQAPTMPLASYSEMRFVGNVVSNLPAVKVGPFYIPGAYDESANSGTINAFNYPVYNVNMGLVALFNTPSAKIEYAQDESIDYEVNDLNGNCPGHKYVYVKNNSEFRIKLDEDLKIAYNKSLDFDFSRTESYGGIEIEVKFPNNPSPDLDAYKNLLDYTVNNTEQNIFVNLDYNVNGDRIIRLNSKWVPLGLLNQYVFSLKREEIYKFGHMHLPPLEGSSCPDYEHSNYMSFS